MSDHEDHTLDGVTDETITLEVTPGQHAQLERDQLYPGNPRVTHKLSVGPYSLPGLWVVTAHQKRVEPPKTRCFVTLARLAED